MQQKVIITVHPEVSLIHEDVAIQVEGLHSHSAYKLELRLHHKTGTYRSFGVYRTSLSGSIVLSRDAPIRGSYVGVNQRGLFESLVPTDDVRFGGYCHCTPAVDLQYQLIIFDNQGAKIQEHKFIRKWMHPLVERLEIEESWPADDTTGKPKVTGTIFKPPGDGPFPTIIDISGSGGGLNEQKGAALASRGFTVLCLAFFKFKNLPKEIISVDLQYFEDAIDYLTSLPFTQDRIGFQGVSFGGTMVMFLSTKCPKIKAVCSINGSWSFDEMTHVLDHGTRPPVAKFPMEDSGVYLLNDLMVYATMCKRLQIDEKDWFKLEDSQRDTAFRFVSSMDDLAVPTISVTNHFSAQLRKLNRTVDIDLVPGGHLLDPPCFPFHSIGFSSFADMFQAFGGEASSHGKSQFEAWERTVQFFSDHLGAPTALPDCLRHSAKL